MYLALSHDTKLASKIISIFILLSNLYGCAVLGQAKHIESFSLIGKLPYSLKGNIYLLNQDGKIVYSSTIKGNRFAVGGKISEPALYQIQIDTASKKYPIFMDASSMQILFRRNGTYQVKGSKLHARWEGYNNHIDQIREQLIGLYQKRSAAQQKGDTVLFNKLMKQNDSVSIHYGTYQKEQIAQKPYSFFSLYLLKNASMTDAYSANMLNEFKPYLSLYPTFRSFEGELKKRVVLKQKVAIGQKAYNFSLPDSTGAMYSLESLRKTNKIILVDFWASWCGPCIKELPNLKVLHEQYASQGLVIVGISIDSNPRQWQKALSKHTPAGVQLLAADTSPLIESYAVYRIPQTFLIDQNGKIQAHNLQGNDLTKKVTDLLLKSR